MRINLSRQLIQSLKEVLPEDYDVEEAIAAILSAYASGNFAVLKNPGRSGISVVKAEAAFIQEQSRLN